MFKNYIILLCIFLIDCFLNRTTHGNNNDFNNSWFKRKHMYVLLKLLSIYITSLIFLVVAVMHGNALVRVMYYTWTTNERSSHNFRRFPPSSRIAISIPCASSITFSISTTFSVSCFRAASASFDYRGYFDNAVSLVVVSLTVGYSDWFSPSTSSCC